MWDSRVEKQRDGRDDLHNSGRMHLIMQVMLNGRLCSICSLGPDQSAICGILCFIAYPNPSILIMCVNDVFGCCRCQSFL